MNHFDHTSSTEHQHHPHQHHNQNHVQLVVSNNDPNIATNNTRIMNVNNQQPIQLMVNISNGNNSNIPFDNHQHSDSNTVSNAAIDSSSNYAYYTYDTCNQLTQTTGVGSTATSTPFQVSWNKIELIEQPPPLATQQSDWYHNQQQTQIINTNEPSQQASIMVSGSSMPTNVASNFVTSPSNFNQQQQFVNTDHTTNIQPIQIAIVPSQSSVQTQIQPSQTSSKSTTKKTAKRVTNLKQSNKGEGRQSKPVSAYALFFRDTQASIKVENPSASFGEISKIVASKWEILNKDEKIVYKERADMEKKSYLQNLASNKAKEIAQTNQASTPSPHQTPIASPIQMAAISSSGSNPQQSNSSDLATFETNNGPSIDMMVPSDDILTESSIHLDNYHQTSYGNYHEQQQQQQPQTTMHQTNTYHQHHNHALTDSMMNESSTTNVMNSYSHTDHHQHPHSHQQIYSSSQSVNSENLNDNQDKNHHSTQPSSSPLPFVDDDSFFVNASEVEQNLIDLGIDLNAFDDINLLNDVNIYSPTNSSVTNPLFDTSNPVVGVDPFLSSLEQTSSNSHHHHHHQQQSTTNDSILTSTYGSDTLLQDSYPSEMIYESNERTTTSDIDHHFENNNNNFTQDSSSTPIVHDVQDELRLDSNITLMNGDNNNLNNDHQQNMQQQQQEEQSIVVCARDGCKRTTIDSNQWDREFCSEECCVRYCSDVFKNWTNRKQQQLTTTSLNDSSVSSQQQCLLTSSSSSSTTTTSA